MDENEAAVDDLTGEGYLLYRVEDTEDTVSAAFFRQAEHLHLQLPVGMTVANRRLTRRLTADRH